MSTDQKPSDPNVTCWIEHLDHALVIHLQGRIGVGEMAQLERASLVGQSSLEPLIIVEMSKLLFISSLGLGMLVQLKRSSTTHGSILRLAAMPALIQELLVNSRLDKLFEIMPTLEQALVLPTR